MNLATIDMVADNIIALSDQISLDDEFLDFSAF